MIADLSPDIRVVLLDIEGTTTPIAFVHDTLFAFAREHLDTFLEQHWELEPIRAIVERLEKEYEAEHHFPPPWLRDTPEHTRTAVALYAHWLMEHDRKSPGLKELQGLIWEDGYRGGQLHGMVWDDVPVALQRWKAAGLEVAIYSSGSELAQRLLFESTSHGDLTPLISAFFDTSVGGKLLPESYSRIASVLKVDPSAVCFVSDVTAELRAAMAAGCIAVLSVRPGNKEQEGAGEFRAIRSFDEL